MIRNLSDAFEQIFDYYRSDFSIRAMFKDQNLNIAVKFGDSKQTYAVLIHQDQKISLVPEQSIKNPDIRIRISSEQLLLDLVNGEIPLSDPFRKGKIMIVKGFAKIARIYRKYIKDSDG